MINHRNPISRPTDQVVRDGIELFTTPLPNTDAEAGASDVVGDITAWMADAVGGDPRPQPGSIRYTPLAVLVAFYVLIRANRPPSQAEAMRVILHEFTGEQREWLGMDPDLAGTRVAAIEAGLAPGADHAVAEASRKYATREYARFCQYFGRMVEGFDPSPFPKRGKMRNLERKAILADPHHPRRRITPDCEAERRERLDVVLNKIVATSAAAAPADGYRGDIAVDETVVIVLPIRHGHGTEDEKYSAPDPDAGYWPGTRDDDDDSPSSLPTDAVVPKPGNGRAVDNKTGHGYGITYVVRVGRPYERAIPNVAVGMHVGPPTGGRVNAFATALEHARRHSLLNGSRNPYAVADAGYTAKNGWAEHLLEHGYRQVCDYPSHWRTVVEIPDTNAEKDPAPGPILHAGQILCPGAVGSDLLETGLGYRGPQPEPAESVIERTRRIRIHQALTMPMKNRPQRLNPRTRKPGDRRPSTSKRRGPVTHTIAVQCPARLGLVNCANYNPPSGQRVAGVPDVPNPPHTDHPHLRPRACTSKVVNYKITRMDLKRLQALPHGSFIHEDYFGTIRSANERLHSQIKSDSSGGVDVQWTQMRGIAKAGLMFAIATAVTNHNLINDFPTKHLGPDGRAAFSNREHARRRRQMILKHQ